MSPTDDESADGLPGHRYTDEQIHRVMGLVLNRVEQLHAQVVDLPEPQPGSPLLGDDRATDPHRVSHAAARSIQAAAEHLDALRGLVGVAGLIHPSAPFTLARGAIETAAAGVWLLAPTLRRERGLRALRHAVRNEIDQNTALTGVGRVLSPPLDERRASVDAIAARLGREGRVHPEKSTEVVKAAEAVGASEMPLLLTWQLCSGFAHGRLWPMLAMLNREVLPGPDSSTARLKVTSSLDRVLFALMAARDVTEYALQLYQLRATGRPEPMPVLAAMAWSGPSLGQLLCRASIESSSRSATEGSPNSAT